MRAFSSHRGLQDSKMRFLIVCTAIVAYAYAAPSHFLPLGAQLTIPAIAYPASIPTISSGDVQAAAIDAQVKYADLAQAAVDKARAISEQTVDELNVKTYINAASDQERLTDALWATEDKKWQTLDAIKTAEAQLDGALASNAPALAKGAILGPYVASVGPYSAISPYSAVGPYSAIAPYSALGPYPGVAPITPVVYPGFVAPGAKSISTQSLVQSHPETIKAEGEKAEGENAEAGEKVEASVKSIESEKSEAEKSLESAEAALSAAKSEADKAFVALQSPFVARSVGLAGTYLTPGVYSSVGYGQPILKYASPLHSISPVVGPAYLKTVW